MEPKAKRPRDFWLGVGLYFVLGCVLYGVGAAMSLMTGPEGIFETLSPLIFAPMIGLPIYLGFKRPKMALGMLAGFGINLLFIFWLLLSHKIE